MDTLRALKGAFYGFFGGPTKTPCFHLQCQKIVINGIRTKPYHNCRHLEERHFEQISQQCYSPMRCDVRYGRNTGSVTRTNTVLKLSPNEREKSR